MILLISKVASHIKARTKKRESSEILPQQRDLAKITEMVFSAYSIHRSVKDILHQKLANDSGNDESHLKNIIYILSGDFLLATVWQVLCEFKSAKIAIVLTKSISDFMEGQYIIETETNVPSHLDCLKYWTKRNFLLNASLQAGTCQSALMLDNCDEQAQLNAYEFGKNFAFAWQIFVELLPFLESFKTGHQISDLMSAPILAHLNLTGDKLTSLTNGSSCLNSQKLYSLVNSGPGIAKARQMRDNFAQKALEALSYFPPSEAANAIIDIIDAIKSQ